MVGYTSRVLGDERESEEADVAQDQLVELMIAYQGGRAEAFEELYVALRPHLYRYVLWRVFDSSRADDLVQDVFLQVHRARATYEPRRPVKPWILGIARNVSMMAMRESSRIPPHLDLDDVDLSVPAELADHIEIKRARQALACLRDEVREVILLRYLWGLSFEEVSGVLGISKGAARVRAHRGMQAIRAEMESETPTHKSRLSAAEVRRLQEVEP